MLGEVKDEIGCVREMRGRQQKGRGGHVERSGSEVDRLGYWPARKRVKPGALEFDIHLGPHAQVPTCTGITESGCLRPRAH